MRVVVTCEHASNAVPPGVDLGVSSEVLASHVAWDPGAAEVAEALALALGAPYYFGRWTRLYVDLNRSATNAQVVPTTAFGVDVPGNLDCDRESRMNVHKEYRDEAAAAIHPALAEGVLHLSIHSFTPDYQGEDRDFDIGVLYDPDRPGEVDWASRIRMALEDAGFHVVNNRPYLGTGDGHTAHWRTVAGPECYVGIEVEISHRVGRERFPAIVGALTEAVRGA